MHARPHGARAGCGARVEGVWNFWMELSITIGWMALPLQLQLYTFSACMQILYDMHDFYCTAVHVLVVLSTGSWVPAGIPTAGARVQMGGEGGCQYAGNSCLIQFDAVHVTPGQIRP